MDLLEEQAAAKKKDREYKYKLTEAQWKEKLDPLEYTV
jgi:hypothetical protein